MKARTAALLALAGVSVTVFRSWRETEARRKVWETAVDPVE